MRKRWKLLLAVALVVSLGSAGAWVWHASYRTHRGASAAATAGTGGSRSCLGQGEFCTGVAVKSVTASALASFTRGTGVFPSIVEYYQAWGKKFGVAEAARVADLGATPLIQINPHGIHMRAIARGKYDRYLRSYALSVKKFGKPVVLSFGHEMNGTWNTWSLPFTQPEAFVAAWRHIHDVLSAEHMGNVTWAWDISHTARPPAPWWPGRKYVNWIGIDGYLLPGQTFGQQFAKRLGQVRQFAPRTPVLITETAVAPGAGQARQVTSLFSHARADHMIGLIWFDVNKQKDWKIENDPAGSAAFKAGASG